MKIDPHKPLPSHTKLRYEECYAKEFLEFLYPNKYKDLAIRDKPDLYDSINDVGIEVVEAENERKKEAVKLWYTMLYVSENKKTTKPYCQVNFDKKGKNSKNMLK